MIIYLNWFEKSPALQIDEKSGLKKIEWHSKYSNYKIIDCTPTTDVLYLANNFLSGHVRMRGKDNGKKLFYGCEYLNSSVSSIYYVQIALRVNRYVFRFE